MALAKASEVTLTQNGIKCPSTSTWNAEYRVTAPEPLWVEASP